ncbi:MAG: hypothetical protein JJT90_01515, partial [Ectothiorhodospiraceae bacterium]|nr:hypothetical protein [Ectothiorhodospiraceae bacterium]
MLASALVVLAASLATTGAAVAGPIGWAVGDGGTILHTPDGGMNWAAQTSGTTAGLRDLDFVDPLTGWAVGTGGTILHTTDGGMNWAAQTSGTT